MPAIFIKEYNTEVTFPEGMSDEDMQSALEREYPPLTNGKQPRENIYNADKDVVINAPIGASAAQIDYHDEVDNLGANKGDYFGYAKSEVPRDASFYDKAFEVLALPTEDIVLQTNRAVTAGARYLRELGVTNEDSITKFIDKMSLSNEKLNQSVQQKRERAGGGFGTDVYVGATQLPYYAALGSARGAAVIYGLIGGANSERIYQEAIAANPDDENALAKASAAGFTSAAVEASLGHLFFKNVMPKLGERFIGRVTKLALIGGAEESGASVSEDVVTIATDIRDKNAEAVISDALYSFAVGAFIGTGATSIAEIPNIQERLRQAGVKNVEQVAEAIKVDGEKFGLELEKAVNDDISLLNDDPSTIDAISKAMDNLASENYEAIAADMQGLGFEDGQIKSTIENVKKMVARTKDVPTLVGKGDVLLAESLALEDKQTTKLQDALDLWKEITNPIRAVTSFTKKQIKETQTQLVEFINQSDLAHEDKGKFLVALRDTQTSAQLLKKIDDIEARINGLIDASQRRNLVSSIENKISKVRKSNVIAVDFAKKVEMLFNEIDLQKRQPGTIKSLQDTLDFMQKNPDANIPNDVLAKLQILNRRKIEDISTAELRSIAAEMDNLIQQGKTKLRLMDAKKEKLKQQRLVEIQKDSVPIESRDAVDGGIFDKLTTQQKNQNSYTAVLNRLRGLGLATNPMDVFFDMLDGSKSYLGANYRIFKKTVDVGYSKYLDLKNDVTKDVKSLDNKLNLDSFNYRRIGVFAISQQEGGMKKLEDTGFNAEEVRSLRLTKEEMQMYKLMRSHLDGVLPAVQAVMRVVYNKDVAQIKNYFSFLTDHDAMNGVEIQDQIGDTVEFAANKKNAEQGFTKERTLGKQAVRVDALQVYLRHMDNAAYLIEMGGHIKSLSDLASDPEYKKAVGDMGQESVADWLNVLARNGRIKGANSQSERFINTLRTNTGIAMLGFKLSTILVQPTALADGAALVGGGYVLEAISQVALKPELRKFLMANMPEIRHRVGDDPSYSDLGSNKVLRSVAEAGFWALKRIDLLSASAVASGAYTKFVEEKGGKVDFSKPDPDAIAYAQRMMRRTQSSAFAKDVAPILNQGKLTGNISVDKLITQFQSFMLNRWSLIKHDMYQNGIKGNTQQSANIATWMIIGTMSAVGLRRLSKEIVGAMFGDEPEDWENRIKQELVNEALGTIPAVSQLASMWNYSSVPVPAIGAMWKISTELKLAGQSKDPAKKASHNAQAAVLMTGVVLGVPGALQAQQIISAASKKDKKKKPAD